MRVFNRHRQRDFWYPSPRSFHVNHTCAAELGRAIISAADGRPYGDPPEWWDEFEEQYARMDK
jgi:hypothetical protein